MTITNSLIHDSAGYGLTFSGSPDARTTTTLADNKIARNAKGNFAVGGSPRACPGRVADGVTRHHDPGRRRAVDARHHRYGDAGRDKHSYTSLDRDGDAGRDSHGGFDRDTYSYPRLDGYGDAGRRYTDPGHG